MSTELAIMNREQLVEALAPTEGLSHVDVEMGVTSGISFKQGSGGQPIVTLAGEEHEMTTRGLQEAARGVGIPSTYSAKCPIDLLFQNLAFWYSGGCAGKLRFFLQHGVVIGCNANRPKYYSNMRLLEQAEQIIGDNAILGYHQVHTSLDHSAVSVVVNRTFEAVPGDILYGGVTLQNSVIGERRIEITPYIFRQWCSNGAITAENINQWSHRNDDGDIGPWVRSSTQSALNALDQEFQQIRRLTEISVEGHVPDTLRSLFRKFGIPVTTQKEIVQTAATQRDGQGPGTMYDIWNSVTRVATHSQRLSTRSSRDLQYVAGQITREYNLCPHCHQLVSEDIAHTEG